MRKLEEITIFDFTDIGGPRATGYDIIEKYMREFFADDPRTQADVMKALDLCIHAAIAHDNAVRDPRPAYDPPDLPLTPQGQAF